MASWLVQFLGMDEFQIRSGDTEKEVSVADEISGQPVVAVKPVDFFPSDRWSILKRKKNGVTLAQVIPKHDIEVS